jgi:hypothetical protein
MTRRLWVASGIVFAFGFYVLAGGWAVTVPKGGAGSQSEDDLVDRPVQGWLWIVAGACCAIGMVGLVATSGVMVRSADASRISPPRFWAVLGPLAIVLPVLGSVLVYRAAPDSDLRGRAWLLLGLVGLTYLATSVYIAAIRIRQRRARKDGPSVP